MFQVYQFLQIAIGIFMWMLIGQGALALLMGEQRRTHAVYRGLSAMTYPARLAARHLSPKALADAHMGFVALLWLLALRFALYMLFYAFGWLPAVGLAAQP